MPDYIFELTLNLINDDSQMRVVVHARACV